jgi:hypothetical protein
MNTIDLLLILGGKIADVLSILLNRRMSNQEKRQAQELLQRYEQIKQAHEHIRDVIRQYNSALERMLAQGATQDVFPFCTYQTYQEVEQLHQLLVRNQVSYQSLEALEILSIDLTTQTVEELQIGSVNAKTHRRAKAYTHERWLSVYQNGANLTQDVINCYQMVWRQGAWKIAGNEVYVKDSNHNRDG